MEPDPSSDSVPRADAPAQTRLPPLPRSALRSEIVGEQLHVGFQLPLSRFAGRPREAYLTLRPWWLGDHEYFASVVVQGRHLAFAQPIVLPRPAHPKMVPSVTARLFSGGLPISEVEMGLGDEELRWQEGAPKDVVVEDRVVKGEGRYLCIEEALVWCCPSGFVATRDTHIAFGLVGDEQMAFSEVTQSESEEILQTVETRLAIDWKDDAPSRMVLSVVEGDVVLCSVPLARKAWKGSTDGVGATKRRKVLTEETDTEYDPETPLDFIDLVEPRHGPRLVLGTSGEVPTGIVSPPVLGTPPECEALRSSRGPPRDWGDAIPDMLPYARTCVRGEKIARVYLCAFEIRYPPDAPRPREPRLEIRSEWNETTVRVTPRVTDDALRFMPPRLGMQPKKTKTVKRLLITLKDGEHVLVRKNASLFSISLERFNGVMAHGLFVGTIVEAEERLAQEKSITRLGSAGLSGEEDEIEDADAHGE